MRALPALRAIGACQPCAAIEAGAVMRAMALRSARIEFMIDGSGGKTTRQRIARRFHIPRHKVETTTSPLDGNAFHGRDSHEISKQSLIHE